MERRVARGGARDRQADPAVRRLLRVPLVPRHGPRVVRGRGDGAAHERALRQHQGRPRGAPRPRQDLPDEPSAPDGPSRRLAAHGVSHSGPAPDLHGHVFSQGTSLRPAGVREVLAGDPRPLSQQGRRDPRARGAARPRARQPRCGERRRLRGAVALAARQGTRAARSTATTPSTAASAAGRSSRTRGTSSSCLRIGTRAAATARGCVWSCTRSTAWRSAGCYDHLGGGFFRYSVDRHWSIPHFEKMLYDNAQLLSVYADAYVATGTARYASVAGATADWVMRDMQDPRRRLLLHARRRLRARGRQVLRVDAGGGRGRAQTTTSTRWRSASSASRRRRTSKASTGISTSPRSRTRPRRRCASTPSARARRSKPRAASCSRHASSASGRAATRSCWCLGTAS